MTTSLEIKITINEFVTPDLFRAVSAVSNPRQRAALLKRLAEDALRNSGPISQIAPTATSGAAGTNVAPRVIQSGAETSSSSINPSCLFSETGVSDEDQRQFECTSDVAGARSQRETVASLVAIVADCKASAMSSTKEPMMPEQPVEFETPNADTIAQLSDRRGFLTQALVSAALAIERSAYWLRCAIIGRETRAKKIMGK
ncbi:MULTISPECIES: hypothetical protein [unclassified Caballeronia]|jgi:hypothetical protein|uniref:hypothetical protein n=1 Tax=unclassified Caballeronia TaxID=2646786 RepID=UPI0020283C5F|nr:MULTISPECIES: hypothetical protein [unclassified Caballeronia]